MSDGDRNCAGACMYLFLFSCLSLSIRWMHVLCVDMHVFVMRNRKRGVRIYVRPRGHVKCEPESDTASAAQGRGYDHQNCSQKNQSLPHTLCVCVKNLRHYSKFHFLPNISKAFLQSDIFRICLNSRAGKVHDCVWYAKSTTTAATYIWNLSVSDSAIPLEQCCMCAANLTWNMNPLFMFPFC